MVHWYVMYITQLCKCMCILVFKMIIEGKKTKLGKLSPNGLCSPHWICTYWAGSHRENGIVLILFYCLFVTKIEFCICVLCVNSIELKSLVLILYVFFFLQWGQAVCEERMDGSPPGWFCPPGLRRDYPGGHLVAPLQRPARDLSPRDQQPWWRNQPQTATDCPWPQVPGGKSRSPANW